MKRITECRVCGNTEIKVFLDLGEQPLANSLLDSPDDNDPAYPLSLSWCPECNLVQLNHTADPEELFSEYVWVTGTSKTAHNHAASLYKEIAKRVPDLKKGYVLEAASNDGTFLKPFVDNGVKVLGIDPAKNIVEMAIKDGIDSECAFFGQEAVEKIVEKKGKAKVVFARNVVPHVANLHDFIKGMAAAVGDDGLVMIEAHYAKIIFEELHYDSIYHEHLCYFTLKSMEALLKQYGMHVIDITTSPISGGSLVYYIKKAKSEEKPVVQEYRDEEKKIKLNEWKSWEDFAKRSFDHRRKILDILKKASGKTVGYGASARSSTLLNFCRITPEHISKIADQNPLKHNKYTAGTHIIIQNPEEVMKDNPDNMFILAWNFADEIRDILKERFKFKGKFIIPLPNDPKIIENDIQ
ncbi:methyltransferase domain-containing protein [Candidatus Woesearchaeota archaeon]|nr:methyltransferase domain-containing protein [Candidatus Woesearchaeota archaeon]